MVAGVLNSFDEEEGTQDQARLLSYELNLQSVVEGEENYGETSNDCFIRKQSNYPQFKRKWKTKSPTVCVPDYGKMSMGGFLYLVKCFRPRQTYLACCCYLVQWYICQILPSVFQTQIWLSKVEIQSINQVVTQITKISNFLKIISLKNAVSDLIQ